MDAIAELSEALPDITEPVTVGNAASVVSKCQSDLAKSTEEPLRKDAGSASSVDDGAIVGVAASAAPPTPVPVKEKSMQERKEDEYLPLLGQYLQCLRNKDAHAKFLEDAVVGPFLSLCLASDSDRVLVGVLKIISTLLKNRDNYHRLKELLHFMDALYAASRNERLHVAVRNKAAAFYESINNAKKPFGNNLDLSNSAEASMEIGKPLATAREVHLHINHSLQKARRVIITRALVKIEGVISVAYNPDQQLCVVRARRVRPEVLGTAVANLGLECYLIAKNEKKEMVKIPMKPDMSSTRNNDENMQEPFYFPEEDDEVVPAANAVAKKGFNENEGGEGWWNSAKKLARKSLFW